jgi:membrane protein
MHRLFRSNVWYRFWATIVRPIIRFGQLLNNATNGLLLRIVSAVDRFLKYGPHEAAALSYYALFSLFPLLLLTIVVSTFFFDTQAASNQIRDILVVFFPGQTAAILQDAVDAALQQRGSASIFAVVVLVWSSASLFGNLEKVMNMVFDCDLPRKIYERRAVGIIMITILIIFLLASVITNLFFSVLGLAFLNQFNTWLSIASLLIPTAFNAGIFAMLYAFVPARRVSWDAILPAAIMGGLSFEIAKKAFVWYLTTLTNFDFVYGSVATVVVFMLWAYVIFAIVLFFAEICTVLEEWQAEAAGRHVEFKRPENPYMYLSSGD